MSVSVCINCQNEKCVNDTSNRLVTESCGHVKCMKCLILEKNGCIACIGENSLVSDDKDSSEVPEEPMVDGSGSQEALKESSKAQENGEVDKEKKTEKKKTETSHILVINDEEGRSYFCTVCKKKFIARSQVAYHAYCNGQRKPYQCKDCDKSFATQSHYKYHMRVHRNEKMYSCEDCGEGFFQMSKLQRHRLKHTNERKYACVTCDKLFNNPTSLRRHTLTHTLERPFICTTCGFKFRDQSNYRKHVFKKHHGANAPCTCKECSYCSSAAAASARRAFACSRCSRTFHNRKDLRRHSAVHTDSKPFRCKVCDRRFRRKDNLDRHIRNTHPECEGAAAAVDCDTTALCAAELHAAPAADDHATLQSRNPLPPLPQQLIQQLTNDTPTDGATEKTDTSYILEANIARESVIFGPIKSETKKQPENEYVHKIRKANRMVSQKDITLPPIDESKIIELERKSSTNNLDVGPLSRSIQMDVYKKILYERAETKAGAAAAPDDEAAKLHWRRKMKLDIVNWYLATGDSFQTISFSFRVGRSTVSSIVEQVCKAIWYKVQPIYMPAPTDEKWKESEAGYRELWGFPNCVGSIDGKHVKIVCPANSGSEYFCYKLFFSIVLLAVVDAFYNFIIVDIGSYGRHSDSGIFENSIFFHEYIAGKQILSPKPLPGTNYPVPHVLIGDEGFGLKPYLMRPFPKTVTSTDDRKRKYNQRLSRARRTVENVFGILSHKWRIFHRPIECNVEKAIHIVKAACCLHNYVRVKDGHKISVHVAQSLQGVLKETITASREPALLSLRRTNQRATNEAFDIREKFGSYFNQSRSA